MAEEITPVQVTEWTTGSGTPCWRVTHQRPDGSMHGHVFPQSTLEWRVAEYGLDSIDEALDIVLHEPWATDPADPMQARDDAAVRVGMVVRKNGPAVDYEAIALHSADSIEDAREAHRIRIADAKTRVHVVPPKGQPDPLDIIRARHGVTDAGVQEKAAFVDAIRRSLRGETVRPPEDILVDPDTHQRAMEIDRA